MVTDERLRAIFCKPFLLASIGDYGHKYEGIPLPPGLAPRAAEREREGKSAYPKNPNLPPPHYYIPANTAGILMNKIDELGLNGLAYWAQNLMTLNGPRGCVNSDPRELVAFAQGTTPVSVVLVTKPSTTPPKGDDPGTMFVPYQSRNAGTDIATHPINTDIVYTERAKTTLVFDRLELIDDELDLHMLHVHCTAEGDSQRPQQYRGMRLPFRSSRFCSCSLVAKGDPDLITDIKLLREPKRRVVAIASLHPHVCGRVN